MEDYKESEKREIILNICRTFSERNEKRDGIIYILKSQALFITFTGRN